MTQPQLVRAFVVVAVVEAVTWLALLVGMYLKHVAGSTEVGVEIAGPIHGAAFMAYMGVAWVMADALDLPGSTRVLALAAGIPPFGSVVFERWASRRGLLSPAPA